MERSFVLHEEVCGLFFNGENSKTRTLLISF